MKDPVMEDKDVLKEYKRIRDKTKKILLAWSAAMGLRWWNLEVDYVYEAIGDGHPIGTAGVATVQWQYGDLHIQFSIPALLKNEDRIEEIVVHELSHALTACITQGQSESEEGNLLEERAVTEIQKALMWVRDAAVEGNLNFE